MRPVICSLPEGSYQRVGLCSFETRTQRLGCSHTTARIKLQDAINELNTGNEEGRGLSLSLLGELNWLDNQIHLLDHRKGEAEKTLAKLEEEMYRAGEQVSRGEELTQATKMILEMERLHDEYVEHIGVLRDRVVHQLDMLIEQTRMKQNAGSEGR
jgi:hypothetical protein